MDKALKEIELLIFRKISISAKDVTHSDMSIELVNDNIRLIEKLIVLLKDISKSSDSKHTYKEEGFYYENDESYNNSTLYDDDEGEGDYTAEVADIFGVSIQEVASAMDIDPFRVTESDIRDYCGY